MKLKQTILAAATLSALTLLGAAGLQGKLTWFDQENAPLPELPEVALGVKDVLFAQPFALDVAYQHDWRAERPSVASGYLLVLEVEDAFTVPRNSLESVLYVGSQTAERLNWGTGSGRVVAICPAALGEDGLPQLDLTSDLVWYGSPELPERVDAERVEVERASAQSAGLKPLAAERVSAALEAGGDLVQLPDRTTLERYGAELILEWSPSEHELAQSMLAPLLR
jgi:hypothetical protein